MQKVTNMHATASIIEFPGLVVETGPKKFEKPLKGYGAFIYNDFIKYSNINVTVIPCTSAGSGCLLKNSSSAEPSKKDIVCDGLFEQLRRCESDFSLFALSSHDYDYKLPFIPVLTGPQTESTEMCLFSYNQTSESKTSVYGITQIDMFVYIPLVFLLFSILFLNILNIEVKKLRQPITHRFVGWRPIAMMHSLRNNQVRKNFLETFRKILPSINFQATPSAVFLLFLLFLLCSTLMMGFIQTNSILKSPPRYIDLIEMAQNDSNKIILMKGINTKDYLRRYPHPSVKKILHPASENRIIYISNLQLVELAKTLTLGASDHFLLANKIVTKVIKAYICNDWIQENDNHANITPPWYTRASTYLEIATIATYSPCIKVNIRKRLDIMFNRVTHSNLFEKFRKDAALRMPVMNELKNLLCVTNAPPFNLMDNNSIQVEEDNFFLFIISLIILVAGIASAIISLLIEWVIYLT